MEASVSMALRLSVLDQSLARAPDQSATALQETLQMAKWCDELDYTRFWVSEHHAFPSVAGSAPEVLLAAVGAATRSIRIGSGGIMLPHYSAYKVAEVFSVLANLYPGRVDLGIGRAPAAHTDHVCAWRPTDTEAHSPGLQISFRGDRFRHHIRAATRQRHASCTVPDGSSCRSHCRL